MAGMATATAPKLSLADLAAALRREPLVSVVGAARMLGMAASNFNRDVAETLTQIPLDGSAKGPTKVFFKSEVRKVARQREAERKRRAARNGN